MNFYIYSLVNIIIYFCFYDSKCSFSYIIHILFDDYKRGKYKNAKSKDTEKILFPNQLCELNRLIQTNII